MRKKHVTKILDKIFPFIPNKWTKISSKPHSNYNKKLGVKLHREINEYFKTKNLPKRKSVEFNSFLRFLEKSKFNLVESEMIIKNEYYYGICDALFLDSDGKYVLVDWKMSSLIDDIGYGFNSYLGDSNSFYNKYSFQVHMYKYLLELNPEIKIDRMYLINFNGRFYEEYNININEKWMDVISTKNKMSDLLKSSISYECNDSIGEYKTISECPSVLLKKISKLNLYDVIENYEMDLIINELKIDCSNELFDIFVNNKQLINKVRVYLDSKKKK